MCITFFGCERGIEANGNVNRKQPGAALAVQFAAFRPNGRSLLSNNSVGKHGLPMRLCDKAFRKQIGQGNRKPNKMNFQRKGTGHCTQTRSMVASPVPAPRNNNTADVRRDSF